MHHCEFSEEVVDGAWLESGLEDGSIRFLHKHGGRKWYATNGPIKRRNRPFAANEYDADFAAILAAEAAEAVDDETFDELFGELDDEREISTERAEQLYGRLVAARGDGNNIDPEIGNQVLADTGRTMDQFNADVAEYIRLGQELESYE